MGPGVELTLSQQAKRLSHDWHVLSSQLILVALDEIVVFLPEVADVGILTKSIQTSRN